MPLVPRVVGGLLIATVVVSIGLPVLGIGSFHAADMIGTMPPWSEQTPYDFQPDNPHVSDTVNAVVPMRTAFRDRVWAGDLPLWNPLLGSGEPLATVPNVGTFSPLTLPYLVAPLWLAPVLTKLLEVGVAVLGMYLLARRWNLGRPAALVGALAFVNSAFLVVWTNWPQSHVGALIPLVFWAVERGVTERRLRAVWPLAPVTAVMWLEGFPAVTTYTLLTAGVYALVRVGVVHGWRARAAARLGALAGAVGLGLGLAAIQLLPFLQFLRSLGLGYREEVAGQPLSWEFLSTLAVPDALGNPVERVYYGPLNYVEGQSWVGVVVLVLLVVLVVRGRRVDVPRGVVGFLLAAAGTGLVLVYLGTPLLDLWGRVPLLGTNFIGRFRAVLGMLLAAGAAIGYEAFVGAGDVVTGDVGTGDDGAGDDPGAGAPGGGVEGGMRRGVTLGLAALGLAVVPLGWVVVSQAAEAGRLVYAVMQAALPALVAVLVLAVVVGRLRGRRPGPWQVLVLAASVGVLFAGLAAAAVAMGVDAGRVVGMVRTTAFGVVVGAVAVLALALVAARTPREQVVAFGAVAIPLLLAAESIAFAHPWWGRTPNDLFYPPTATHAFLEENLGTDRFAAANSTLYPGTNAVYGLRSVTAHAFLPVAYREYLRAIDPTVYDRSSTFPFLSTDPATATSPLLDRAAARYWAVGPLDPLYGEARPEVQGEQALTLAAGDEVSAPLPAGALRGVTLVHQRSTGLAGRPAVVVEVRGPADEVVARGSTRLHRWVGPGDLPVALADVEVPPGSRLVVRLEGADAGTIDLASDGERPAYSRTVPADDGLDLVHTAGAVLYANTDALPRVRWAGRAVVAPDPAARLALLSEGPAPDVVVLDRGEGDDEASDASLAVVEDSGDVVAVEVVAEGAGHVVVADGMQHGWHVEVDGQPAPLVDADHAFGAVAVPAGEHVVRFRYDPPGWRTGQLVTLVSVVLVLLLAVLDRRDAVIARSGSGRRRATQGAAAPGRQEG